MKGKDLKEIINNSGVKLKDIAAQSGIPEPTIYSLYKKDTIKKHYLDKLDFIVNKKTVHYKENDSILIVKEPTSNELVQNFGQDTSLFKAIPFYDINVSAGNVSFLDGGILKGRQPDDYMYIPKNIDADVGFPTYGHSMYPVISNGDKVAYKVIKNLSFFNYGLKYLIVTDEQRMVKYVKKHNKEGHLLLLSENKDYDPIDMPIEEIKLILQVRFIGKIEM